MEAALVEQLANRATKAKILIVDDNVTIRSLVKMFLGRDFEYFDATDGRNGLTMASLVRPNLIISDVNMPQLNGIEFLRQLRSNTRDSVSRIPVIMLTGEDRQQDCIGAGATDFVRKPVTPNGLVSVVRRLLPQ